MLSRFTLLATIVLLLPADKRIAADPAYAAWVKGLDRIRKIVSDSLYAEARP